LVASAGIPWSEFSGQSSDTSCNSQHRTPGGDVGPTAIRREPLA
jgi:hypothetical protein